MNKDKLLKKYINREDIRKDKKIWLWIILFPPIGIYRAIKYKAFSKPVIYILTTIFLLAIALGFDTMLYPNRVFDSNVRKAIKSNEDMGEFRQGDIIGSYENKYIIYNVVTSNGIYDMYLSNNAKTVNAIIKTSPESELVYQNNFELKDTNISSEVLRFFNEENNKNKYGEIEKVLEEDDGYQVIKTSNNIYKFTLDYEQVIKIEKQLEDNSYEDVYNKEPILRLSSKIDAMLRKREKKLGKLKEVVSYKVNEEIIEYVIKMDNGNQYKVSIDNNNIITIYNADTNTNS